MDLFPVRSTPGKFKLPPLFLLIEVIICYTVYLPDMAKHLFPYVTDSFPGFVV